MTVGCATISQEDYEGLKKIAALEAQKKALTHAMHMSTLRHNAGDLDFQLMSHKEISRYIEECKGRLRDV